MSPPEYWEPLRRSQFREGGNVRVVSDMSSKVVGQFKKGTDHLGILGWFPVFGHFNLGRSHVDMTLSDAEAHDIRRVGAQLGLLKIEGESMFLQDQLMRFQVVFPMLVVDDDTINVDEDSWEILEHRGE